MSSQEKAQELAHKRLLTAIKAGDADAVRAVCEAGDLALNTRPKVGDFPLCVAALGKNLDIVRLLLDHGAKENVDAALLQAAIAGNEDVARMLIESGANLNVSKMGKSLLHLACSNQPTLSYSRSGSHRSTRAALLRLLVEQGADVLVTDMRGRSPLGVLLHGVDTQKLDDLVIVYQSVRLLCSRGADWDAKCDEDLRILQRLLGFRKRLPDEVRIPQVDDVLAADLKLLQACSKDDQMTALYWRQGLRRCFDLWRDERHRGSFTDIPVEVIKQGANMVDLYISDGFEEGKMCIRSKLCLIGTSFAGKTTLAVSIKNEDPTLAGEEDRTVALDRHAFSFVDNDTHHVVTLYDFAGQDVYDVVRAPFHSRALYLHCLEIPKYLEHLPQQSQLSLASRSQDRALDEYFQIHFIRWVESIAVREPEAKIVVVGTKKDLVADGSDPQRVWNDVLLRLDKWQQAIEIRDLNERRRVSDQRKRVVQCVDKNWVVVTCSDSEGVAEARKEIERLVATSGLGIEMGDKWNRVFKLILELRKRVDNTTDARLRIESQIIPVIDLCHEMQRVVGGLSADECRGMLSVFHDLGYILWHKHPSVGALCDNVIIDPLVVIDFVKEVVTHERDDSIASTPDVLYDEGLMAHDVLCAKSHWAILVHDEELLDAFKGLLKHFEIVYPAHGDIMHWNSDLIVPAFWETKPLHSLEEDRKEETAFFASSSRMYVRWEYEVSSSVSKTIFKQFAVQCHTSQLRRDIVPNAIKFLVADDCIARVVLFSTGKPFDTVRFDIAAADANTRNARLQSLVSSMEAVLEKYKGINVKRTIVDVEMGLLEENRYPVESLVDDINFGSVISLAHQGTAIDMRWFVEKVWRHPGRLEAIQMRAFVREIADTTSALRKLAVQSGRARLYPALWTATLSPVRKTIWVYMRSDLSMKCFHDAIKIEVPPRFLVKYENLLKAGCWIFTTVLPECFELGPLQNLIDEASSAVDGCIERAQVVHNFMDCIDQGSSAPFVSTSQSSMSPDEACTLLCDLLKLANAAFDARDIPRLSQLQCAEFEGTFVWCHKDEISSLGGKLVPCEPDYSAVVASLRNHLPPSSTFACEVAVTSLAGTRFWNRYRVFSSWKLVDASGTSVADGETSISSDCAWGDKPVVVTSVDGIAKLGECTLQVTTKRYSRAASKIKPLGEGNVALSDTIAKSQRLSGEEVEMQVSLSDSTVLTVSLTWQNAEFA